MNRFLVAVLFAFASVITACAQPNASGLVTVLTATITDDSIVLDQATVESGLITFGITNQGEKVHEFEIFATDAAAFEVVQNVADTSGADQVDEVEDVIPGSTVTLDVPLGPGHYLIISNYPGEYEAGMVTALTVTG
jgi:uncharacterized cupredoxin-like copper-binding protein